MYLIDQHTKGIMEECKLRARDAGLTFDDETLEYIVSNKDLIELSPKAMIPTLYDYWVNDVEVLKGKGKYKLYPQNPYETVINSRPAISFYNDNNPDWLNIMIFYHVLGHIDFFQNNILFEKTWNDDFVGQALADKRLIETLRREHGRWVDYVIEFSRSIDNITGYFGHLSMLKLANCEELSPQLNFYFDTFLHKIAGVHEHEIFKEIERYNLVEEENKELAESIFLKEVNTKYPEFESKFKNRETVNSHYDDLLEFIREKSPFLNKEKNKWMKSLITIVRNTSLYFAPQIRTKIVNEGWASYWHDELFRKDNRINGHEADYAKINSGVTSISRIGLNPYAIGMRLIQHVKDLGNKGRINSTFQEIKDINKREDFNLYTGQGDNSIFELRKNFSDFMLVNTYTDQDFVDEHNLFVVGKRMNEEKGVVEYYVKSRKAEEYKQMLIQSLYHPPKIEVDMEKTDEETLYLVHKFENRQLFKEYIPDTLLGIEYLWGGRVHLETTEIVKSNTLDGEATYKLIKVVYTAHYRKITKENI